MKHGPRQRGIRSGWMILVAVLVGLSSGGCATTRPAAIEVPAETGMASYYSSKFHNRRTASGERYSKFAMTAAHRTLPFGTRVRVTHLATGRHVDVVINDRGPFVKGRIIDLSYAAAHRLGMVRAGTAEVRIERRQARR